MQTVTPTEGVNGYEAVGGQVKNGEIKIPKFSDNEFPTPRATGNYKIPVILK